MAENENKKSTRKKGMLFGKINIVDLFVILILLCALAFGITLVSGMLRADGGSSFMITYSAEEVSDFVIEKLEENCRMYDDTEKVELGRCESVETGDSLSSFVTDEGNWVIADKPDYSSLVLKASVRGKKLDNGVEIGGHDYHIGDFVVLHAGIAKVYIQITSIEPQN